MKYGRMIKMHEIACLTDCMCKTLTSSLFIGKH